MFTGLVEVVGTVRVLHRQGSGARLEVEVKWPTGDPPFRGDSVAVNGACLTTVSEPGTTFIAELSPETMNKTLLGLSKASDRVNLERALRLGDRLGGHLVQGHIDGTCRLLSIEQQGTFARWRLSLPAEVEREVAAKGSVCLDGVSLTVAQVAPGSFDVALIPETLASTSLGGRRPGHQMHIETDVLAKYVGRHLDGQRPSLVQTVFGSGG